MTVPSVGPGDPLSKACDDVMFERATSHVLVLEKDVPIGMVSSLDIASIVAWGRV